MMMNKKDSSQKALNLWAIILIVWSLYRANLKLPEWFDEFIAKPAIFVLPVYYYIKRYEKSNFFAGLDWKLKTPIKDIIIGLSIGLVFFVTMVIANAVKFHRFVFFQGKNFTLSTVILIISISLATAISEEILSRGFILKRLYQESKNVLTSSLYASFLFLFLHIPILFTTAKLNGYMIIFILGIDMILSMINSLLFFERKNLTPVILVHALYNLTLYFFS